MTQIPARQLLTATPVSIGSANSPGSSDAVPKSDHVHAHGNQATSASALHADAVAAGNSGFMSGADKTKLNGITALADPTIATLAAAASAISVNSQRITNVTDPSGAQDAATKAYVDAMANGLDVKASVRCATIVGGGSFNPSSTAPSVVDGVTLVIGDRVLVKDHVGTANGIWVVGTVGTGANGVWARSTDADTIVKVTPGMFTFVMEGTVNADTGWVLTNDTVTNLAVTVLAFAKFSSFALATASPADVAAAAVVGTGSKAARDDHAHAHGNQATSASALHAVAVAGGNNGFFAGADKTLLDAMTSSVKLNCKLLIATNVTVAGGAPSVVDSNTLLTGTRVLAVGQTTISENGIYTVTTVGTGADGTWTKSTDTDALTKINSGNLIFVWGGSVYAGTLWAFSNQPSGSVTAKMVGGPLSSVTPQPIGSSTPGTAIGTARIDHVHAHGNQASVSAYHAVAVAGGNNGFLSGTDKTKLDSLAAGQAATVGILTVDVLLETPSAPAYSASLNLDTSTKNDFAIGVLTGNLAITLTNPAAGRQGTIWVKQDATGGRTVSFTVSGYTVVKDTLAVDLNPASGANALTQYSYAMFTIGGTNYCQIAKSFLS